MKRGKRIVMASEAAQDAFWEEVCKHFPEVKSGDFDPWALHDFNEMCEAAVAHWFSVNRPRRSDKNGT